MEFSANLGFLWRDLALPDAIRAAARAGFAAVECHFPYDEPVEAVQAALDETGLAMLGLNTRRGDDAHGLCALPGREAEARTAIEEAVAYATATGAGSVHVMAGIAEGAEAEAAFRTHLRHACALARPHGITVLIEPLNHYDVPGYFLSNTDHAARIIEAVGDDGLKLMFDCYHVQIMEGDVCRRFARLLPLIGHVQIASVPDRGPPDHGELDYSFVLGEIAACGWKRPIGAEYRPAGAVEDGLAWLDRFRAI